MAIDDRVRDALHRSAQGPEAAGSVEHLWDGIERGVVQAHRRQLATRFAVAGVSLAAVAAAIAVIAVAFGGPRREPAAQRGALPVRDVHVLAASGGVAKILGTVANEGTRPVGAAIRCVARGASGSVLGRAAGSVPWIQAGGAARFAVGGSYRAAPRSAVCTATAVAASSPSPVAAGGFQPLGVAFWDGRHGLMSGVYGEPECSPRCTWELRLTSDGGTTWHQVERSAGEIFDVAIVPPSVLSHCVFACGLPEGRSSWAWALQGPCAMGTCSVDVRYSGDGGNDWLTRATTDLNDVSFVDATNGWGLSKVFANGQRIERTTDGGKTWRTSPVPCPSSAPTGVDVSFVEPQRGWLLCAGPGGAGNANRAVLAYDGARWHVVSQAVLGGPRSGGLTSAGYPIGIDFLSDGHGWMWSNRAVGLLATTDAGVSWHRVGDVPNGASTAIGSVWFLPDATGFAILDNGDAHVTQLIETTNGGRTWRVVQQWKA
jgi:hypothetical protein